MSYLSKEESAIRVAKVKDILKSKNLDAAIVYFDEFNIGNGWYLTGYCPQFESGAVLVPRDGNPFILGGPESEPFAKLESAIKETRNFPVFMVPDEEYPNATIIDFPQLFLELKSINIELKNIGLVGGGRMPADCYHQILEGFEGVALVDITQDFVELRFIKSEWEKQNIRKAFKLADKAYLAMKTSIGLNTTEIKVAAAGEYAVRFNGANGFGFSTIVGSGIRSNAVVPTASNKELEEGEMVMIGISPKVNGYAGVVGDTLPVNGEYSKSQKKCIEILKKAFRIAKDQLIPGKIGKEMDAPVRAYFEEQGLSKYLVCPFIHTIGLHEAESPFFGPNSEDELKEGMMICIDISFFGHPEWHGVRIESGYEITKNGAIPLSPHMDELFCEYE
ncbi:M24 family metallopeptidase [Membranihabitans marinus]|uniref:M24 family metallopeptidase n=1 Tax=Membranihabitans marinus TaxID=1227546 RepID=UPI001F43B844|nr:Xaa-Pro peptidase family protein [Membranihabitans marinus]